MKMRMSARKWAIACSLAIAVVFFNQCTKSTYQSTNTSDYTVTDIMKSSINATVFYKALVATGLDTVLKGQGPFTVFVPTDSAFATSGITASTIASVPASVIKNLILYYTIAGSALNRASFPAGPNARMIMAGGDSVFITNNSAGFFVNGIPIAQSDIQASNGVIHAITLSALLPPQGTLSQLIQSDTTFSLLAAAVTRASQGATNVQNILNNMGPLTFLAPVNSAFRNAGYATTNDINSANADTLANLLLYHMVGRRLFTPDLVDGQKLLTPMDSSFAFVAVSGHWKVKGSGDSTNANLINANIMARNGVFYIIDQVLTP
jgi:uncharacterized surface protein with fasciclin (FAS1) repeats